MSGHYHLHAIEVKTKIKNYQKFSDAYIAFRKGTRPEYNVTKRVKNLKGETVKAEFKRIYNIKGIYNTIANKINNFIDKIVFKISN